MKVMNQLMAVMLLVSQFCVFAPEAEVPRESRTNKQLEEANESYAARAEKATKEQAQAAKSEREAIEAEKARLKTEADRIRAKQLDNPDSLTKNEKDTLERYDLLDTREKQLNFIVADAGFDVRDSSSAIARDLAAKNLEGVDGGSSYSDAIANNALQALETSRKSLVTLPEGPQKDITQIVNAVTGDGNIAKARDAVESAKKTLGLSGQTMSENIKPTDVYTAAQDAVSNARNIAKTYRDAAYRIDEIALLAGDDTVTTNAQIEVMKNKRDDYLQQARDYDKVAFDAANRASQYAIDRLTGARLQLNVADSATINNSSIIATRLKGSKAYYDSASRAYQDANNSFTELISSVNIPFLRQGLGNADKTIAARQTIADSTLNSLKNLKDELIAARDNTVLVSAKGLELARQDLQQTIEYLDALEKNFGKSDVITQAKLEAQQQRDNLESLGKALDAQRELIDEQVRAIDDYKAYVDSGAWKDASIPVEDAADAIDQDAVETLGKESVQSTIAYLQAQSPEYALKPEDAAKAEATIKKGREYLDSILSGDLTKLPIDRSASKEILQQQYMDVIVPIAWALYDKSAQAGHTFTGGTIVFEDPGYKISNFLMEYIKTFNDAVANGSTKAVYVSSNPFGYIRHSSHFQEQQKQGQLQYGIDVRYTKDGSLEKRLPVNKSHILTGRLLDPSGKELTFFKMENYGLYAGDAMKHGREYLKGTKGKKGTSRREDVPKPVKEKLKALLDSVPTKEQKAIINQAIGDPIIRNIYSGVSKLVNMKGEWTTAAQDLKTYLEANFDHLDIRRGNEVILDTLR